MNKGREWAEMLMGSLIWAALLFKAFELFGWAGVIIPILLLVAFFGIHHLNRKKRERAEAQKPCQHGVIGAYQNFRQCSVCFGEYQQREEERIKEAAIRKEREKEQRRQVQWWKQLDGKQFENELASLFRKQGYDATVTPFRGDGGVDIVLHSDAKLIIVQCKAHKSYISPGVVRELYGTMVNENADEGWLVTTADKFYPGARKFVRDKPIRLITISELLKQTS
jgi:restriction endonuclease Mrr